MKTPPSFTDLIDHSIRLAEIGLALHQWSEKIEKALMVEELSHPISRDFTIPDCILDLWRIPTENLPDGDWSDEAFIPGIHYCRDRWHDLWFDAVLHRGDCREFVETVAGLRPLPE
jgi:hypothetical protein